MSNFAIESAATPAPPRSAADSHAMWSHCRNALGIARLLVSEGRPTPLVDTACRTAVEAACRTALEHAGFYYDGDLERGLELLSAPHDLLAGIESGDAASRLAACTRAVAFLAGYLKSEAPERSWAF